jgi:hypothetical protein
LKIFGITFGEKNKSVQAEIIDTVGIQDITPENNLGKEIATKSVQEIGSVSSPAFVYQNHGGLVSRPNQRRNIFEPTEYDLYEIGRIEDVESYVRQAFKKQVGLFLKEGFDYVGSNKKIVKYLKTRFSQIERATSIPHEELIRRLASSFVRKSNAFIVKVRSETASGGSVRVDASGKSRKPIAGYFPIAPETMQVQVDGSGKPYKWRQMLPNGVYLDFDPADIVHIHFDRKEGFLFGTPLIMPVIDDIRALRKIEENIELLIYKHLFPLFQYIVGTEKAPAGIGEDGRREIDVARFELQQIPTEGGIVTPERHEIRSIGSESKALRAENYLQHFKQRVISGLGMSAVDFGEGDSSNRSTADNMSRSLVDNIKDMQDSFESQFNIFIINELLEESTFTDEILSPENITRLEFREIDIDKQIKVENQAADLFAKNAITWSEMRRDLGRDPIQVPEDGETQDRNKYPEWFNTQWKLFHEPEKLINAGDESYTSLALAESPSTSITSGQIAQQQGQKQANELQLVKAKAAAKPKPIKKKDNFLKGDYSDMKEIVIHEISKQVFSMDYLREKLKIVQDGMSKKLRTQMNTSFLSGLGASSEAFLPKIQSARNQIHDRSELLIKRLIHDIVTALQYKVDTKTQGVKISTVHAVFDSFKYRIDFITQTEVTRANNLGKIMKVAELGGTKGKYTIQEDTCETCKNHAVYEIHLHGYSLDTVPPHHPGCLCGLQISEVRNT